jgi:hypothetical protein
MSLLDVKTALNVVVDLRHTGVFTSKHQAVFVVSLDLPRRDIFGLLPVEHTKVPRIPHLHQTSNTEKSRYDLFN